MNYYYERRHQPLAPPEVFRRRLIKSGTFGSIMVAISLAVGMAGYYFFEHLGVLDSFVNASMILSGMGPLHDPTTVAGKLFAGFFALYSGFAVLVIAAVTFAPVIHRILHKFHLETDEDQDHPGRTGERTLPAQKR
jgi:hypothetical protein